MDVPTQHTTPSPKIYSGAGRLPDFLIIGAMKSGTTTLYKHLRSNARIFLARAKEPMFFSRDDVYARGVDWYRSLFREARTEQVCGECSTCYSRRIEYPRAVERIALHLPDAKLIYLMRHPAERAYAVYRYAVEHLWPKEPMSFESAKEQYHCPIIDSGMYIREIEHCLRWFRRDQLLLLILNDLKEDPDDVLRQIEAFLGLDPREHIRTRPLVANRFGSVVAHRRASQRLESIRQAPVFSGLVSLLPRTLRRRVRKLLGERMARRLTPASAALLSDLTPLSDTLRAELVSVFEPSVNELEEFLGRSLPSWHS